MRRILLAALPLLLLTAHVAEARQVTKRIAVISLDSHRAAGATMGKSDVILGQYVDENVTAVLNEWGVDYVKINAKSIPTGKMEWYRTGVFAIGPDTITVSGVLHERVLRQTASLDFPQYRPDSLFLAARRPSVPQLMMVDVAGSYGDITSDFDNVAACSTGVKTVAGGPGFSGGSGIAHECEACQYTPGNSGRFFPVFANYAYNLDLVNQPSGGVYALASTYTNRVSSSLQDSLKMPISLMEFSHNATYRPGVSAAPDTAWLWKLPRGANVPATTDNNGASAAAAPIVCGAFYVSVGDNEANTTSRADFSYEHFLVGLAAFDSCLSGRLLGEVKVAGHESVPKKLGLTIDGAFAHSAQEAYKSGTYITDSSAVKASFDSLAAYGIPYLVGVNVDSVASYPNEKAWFTGLARFTPQVWRGADGGICDTTTRYKLTDIFGHSRARQAYGPAVWRGSAADTSTYALLTYAFQRCDSLFPGRSSRFLLPPFDDYVPTNAAMGDSMLIAARLAGASGIRIAGSDTLRASQQTRNQQGWWQGLKLLAHSGEYVTGGSRIASAGDGAGGAPLDSGYAYHPFCAITSRAYMGLARNGSLASQIIEGSVPASGLGPYFVAMGSSVHPNATNGTTWVDPNKYANGWGLASRTSLLKVHMAGLGGVTHVGSLVQPNGTTPMRPGWWAVRSVDGLRASMNAVAGRTLVMWTYPESIEP